LIKLVYGVNVFCLVRLNVYFCQLHALKNVQTIAKVLLKSLLNAIHTMSKNLLEILFYQQLAYYSVMTKSEPELSGTRNYRVAYSVSIFWFLFILDQT
jgi:hypothetical protein